MKLVAPPKPTFQHFNHSLNKQTLKTPTLIQIQLSLNKPVYKPIQLKSQPKKPDPKPISTTSDILYLMDTLKLPIPLDIYTSLIKECTQLKDPLKAIELYDHMKTSRIRLTLPLLNMVLLMYVSCDCFEHARKLFDQMLGKDFNSWAIIIAACVENGEYDVVLGLFMRMLREMRFERASKCQLEFSVSGILVCVLKSCLRKSDLEVGKQVHGLLWKMGFYRNVVLGSSLISFYGKLGCLEDAKSVFEQIANRNTVLWTSKIVNCCHCGDFEEAVNLFNEMGSVGVRKNAYTFTSVLKACGRIGDIQCGRQVHANAMKLGLESDGFVQCALVDLYGKCGLLQDANKMFEMRGNRRNGACCNAMLTNYAQHGLCEEVTQTLQEMKLAGFEPNESSCSEINLFCGARTILTDSVDRCL